MQRNLVFLIIFLIVLFSAGFLYKSKISSFLFPRRVSTAKIIPAPTNVTNAISVVLSEENSSGESGLSTIQEFTNNVVIDVKMVGTGPSDQKINLYKGSCDDKSQVLFPLKDLANGSSRTSIQTTIGELKKSMPIFIGVLNLNNPKFASCGQIPLK